MRLPDNQVGPLPTDEPTLPLETMPSLNSSGIITNPPLPSPKKEPDAKTLLTILLALVAAMAAILGGGGGGGGSDGKDKEKDGSGDVLPEGAVRDSTTGEVVIPRVVTDPKTGEKQLEDPRTGKLWPSEVGIPPKLDTPEKLGGWFGPTDNSALRAGKQCPEDISDAELEWYERASERILRKYKTKRPSDVGEIIQTERIEAVRKELERRHHKMPPKDSTSQG